MTRRLEGKVALVTGAGASGPGWGNGKAAAVLFAREGAKVFCVDIDLAAAKETARIICGEGGQALAHEADVSDSAAVEALVAACSDAFGGLQLLHNNVGIARLGGPEDLPEDDWDRVMDVNLKSMYLTCRFALPVMLAGGGGAIVNVASIAGLRWLGVPYIAYASSKGAVISFTRAVALEYAGRGIRANCVVPGLMDTPMVHNSLKHSYGAGGDVEKLRQARDALCPMGKMGDAWDVAHAALFLLSEEARYITATELLVDGGVTAKIS